MEAQLREVAGYSAESAPPADAEIYALTPEELAPYRLSDAEREALEAQGGAQDDDVQGYQYIGQFPGWVAVAPGPVDPFQYAWQRWVLGAPGMGTVVAAPSEYRSKQPYPGLR